MRAAVYNSAIPDVISNTVNRSRAASIFLQIWLVVFFSSPGLLAVDWSAPEQQLAHKIVAITGPGAVAVTFENHSSLSRRDCEIIENGLRSFLQATGVRFVQPDQAAATLAITLSENQSSYVWVGEVHQGTANIEVVIVSTPRPEGAPATRDSVPLNLRKSSLWSQSSPILDVAALEESSSPTHIAVLSGDNVSLYRMQSGKWQPEQSLSIPHTHPWPRDLRGRLILAKDHLFDVYLPGVMCRTNSGPQLTMACRDSDDPWPLISGTLSGSDVATSPSTNMSTAPTSLIPQLRAFFAPARNFFTGAVTPSIGKFTSVPKFYSAAFLPRERYSLWLFAAADGEIHMIDGVSDQAAKLGWGSDLTTVKTTCGPAWQVLATSTNGPSGDSLRAYEFPDRDPVAVSVPLEFSGPLTALWTEGKGDTAIAVMKDRETGGYEAYRVAVACNQ